jgi:hypothetical protein
LTVSRDLCAGALTAVVTGAVMAFMVTIAGEGVSSFVAAILALTIPLLVAGLVFGWLTQTQRLHSFGRAIVFWAAAFAVSRLTQQLLIGDTDVKDGLIGFMIYQMIVGILFGLGFMLLYQQVLAGFQKVLGGPPSDGEEPE